MRPDSDRLIELRIKYFKMSWCCISKTVKTGADGRAAAQCENEELIESERAREPPSERGEKKFLCETRRYFSVC